MSVTVLEDRAEIARTVSRLAIPAPLALLGLGLGGITFGLLWDISWHSTIGRDTFWTPAHLAIYLGSMLAGLVASWLIWRASWYPTSGSDASSVQLVRLRAPLGAWVVLWGMATMLVAAGFDNWWHEAYGLDVGILTPAHSLLSTGMLAVHVGALMLITAAFNRAAPAARRQLGWLLLVAAGITLMLATILLMEFNYPNQQHGATFYRISAAAYPLWLVMIRRAVGWRFAATATATIYTLSTLAMLWLLPLFAARPLLAPIFNPVDHMWPGLFPLLLIVPAVSIDLILPRSPGGGEWRRAWVLGALFVALFVAVQWWFSDFLLSPAARNAFFGADQWYFAITHTQEGIGLERLGAWRHQFWGTTVELSDLRFWGVVWPLAALSARFGLGWGRWMSELRR